MYQFDGSSLKKEKKADYSGSLGFDKVVPKPRESGAMAVNNVPQQGTRLLSDNELKGEGINYLKGLSQSEFDKTGKWDSPSQLNYKKMADGFRGYETDSAGNPVNQGQAKPQYVLNADGSVSLGGGKAGNPNINPVNKSLEEYKRNVKSITGGNEKINRLSTDEAVERASRRLNPIYDTRMRAVLNSADRSAKQRGFFGQLPAEALRANMAMSEEQGRVAGINQAADSMLAQDEQKAQYLEQMQRQGKMDDLLAFDRIFNAETSDKQFNQNKALAEAGLTGLYGGDKTMAGQRADMEKTEFETKIPYLKGSLDDEKTIRGQTIEGNRIVNDSNKLRFNILPKQLENALKLENLNIGNSEYDYNQKTDLNSIFNKMQKAQLEGVELGNIGKKTDNEYAPQVYKANLANTYSSIGARNREGKKTDNTIDGMFGIGDYLKATDTFAKTNSFPATDIAGNPLRDGNGKPIYRAPNKSEMIGYIDNLVNGVKDPATSGQLENALYRQYGITEKDLSDYIDSIMPLDNTPTTEPEKKGFWGNLWNQLTAPVKLR